MALIVKKTPSKISSAKKNITLKNLLVSELRFVDETGEDLTDRFRAELPEDVTQVTLKASFEFEDGENDDSFSD